VQPFAKADPVPESFRPAPPPPPPAPPPQAAGPAYVGRIPLPEGRSAPVREDAPPPVAPAAAPAAAGASEAASPGPETKPGEGVSIARGVQLAIDGHFGDIRKLNAQEKEVIQATFPDVSLTGAKGILVVVFAILLPRMIEHPMYQEWFKGLFRWVKGWFVDEPAPAPAQPTALPAKAVPAAEEPETKVDWDALRRREADERAARAAEAEAEAQSAEERAAAAERLERAKKWRRAA
jgi:hypothetical protein